MSFRVLVRSMLIGACVTALILVLLDVWSAWDLQLAFHQIDQADLNSARLSLLTILVAAAAGGAAIWAGLLTRSLVLTSQEQLDQIEKQTITAKAALDGATHQLKIALEEQYDNRVARLQDLKPVIFSDRVEDHTRQGFYEYVVRNVGGGFATNVWYYGHKFDHPISIGSIGRQESAPIDNSRQEHECNTRRIVRPSRSNLAFDVTRKLLAEEEVSAANCARGLNTSRSRRNRSARSASTVRSTSADPIVSDRTSSSVRTIWQDKGSPVQAAITHDVPSRMMLSSHEQHRGF